MEPPLKKERKMEWNHHLKRNKKAMEPPHWIAPVDPQQSWRCSNSFFLAALLKMITILNKKRHHSPQMHVALRIVWSTLWNGWRGNEWRGNGWRGNGWRGNGWRGNGWRGNGWRGDGWRLPHTATDWPTGLNAFVYTGLNAQKLYVDGWKDGSRALWLHLF